MANETAQPTDDENKMRDFAALHPVGFCKMPRGFSHKVALRASTGFLAPSRIDLRDYCTPTEDQGLKPWCAAYSAAQWAENIKWRLTGRPEDVDPAMLYKYAKEHDGDPCGEGTTLTAVMDALHQFVFKSDNCRVKVIRNNRLSVKYAIHRFGCALGGFNIDSSWWGVKAGSPVVAGTGETNLGGHAILICGYDKQGVWIQNSWGKGWGEWGFAKIPWDVFDREFMYGAVLTSVLDGLTLD